MTLTVSYAQCNQQHSDRTRTIRTGGDRKLQNLFNEGQGSELVTLGVNYLTPLVLASVN